MTRFSRRPNGLCAALLFTGLLLPGSRALAQADPRALAAQGSQELVNLGQQITPLAPDGASFTGLNPDLVGYPDWLAGQAVTTVVSPDQKTLLVLTSGFNRVYKHNGITQWSGEVDPLASTEHVFVYDISTAVPVKKQVLRVPNTYNGIAFDPSGEAFYVSGGCDDVVHIVARDSQGKWGAHPNQSLVALDHDGAGVGIPPFDEPSAGGGAITKVNSLLAVKPATAGLALSSDGRTMVAVNYYNDSISILGGGLGRWIHWRELDLRPGKGDARLAGTPGGTYPFWVAITGTGPSAKAWVSSIRDREIVVADIGATPRVATRIKVKGQPIKMVLNRTQTRLYVVEDQSDTVDVIDTATKGIVRTIPLLSSSDTLPAALSKLTGANPNSATLSPDETQLWVTFGNLNCLAVVTLDETAPGPRTIGLVPTGWYPNSVSFGAEGLAPDGRSPMAFVVNGKAPTGPNPDFCYFSGPTEPPDACPGCTASNSYGPQLLKAGLQAFPVPAAVPLKRLTAQVAVNNRFSSTVSAADARVMATLREGVRHVIFVIKENRAYDQVLGDLRVGDVKHGDGDESLAMFGEAITPNQHQLARQFVTMDRFFCTGETSYDGWGWTTSARAPDVMERQFPATYAGRGFSLDSEGTNRAVNVSLATLAERLAANPIMPNDPDLLAGQTNVAAPDGPENEVNKGYLWDAAMRAGLSVKNYGFFLDTARYNLDQSSPYYIPLDRDPYKTKRIVAFPTSTSLSPFTDLHYRGFDPAYPDLYRFKEWARDFDCTYGEGRSTGEEWERCPRPNGSLPALTLVRLMNDHTGSFDTAIDGMTTPELQVATNDYALSLLVEKISKSRYASDTLVFVIEDDSQDGGDHVDSHRSAAHVIGAWVKRGEVVSTPYNTLDFLRTMEEILGIPPMNLNDALAHPMADVFTTTPQPWSFDALPAAILYGTTLPLPPMPEGVVIPKPTRDGKYWANATKGMDFSSEDKFNFAEYNRILWKGLMGDRPYPDRPARPDLRRKKELPGAQAAGAEGAVPPGE